MLLWTLENGSGKVEGIDNCGFGGFVTCGVKVSRYRVPNNSSSL